MDHVNGWETNAGIEMNDATLGRASKKGPGILFNQREEIPPTLYREYAAHTHATERERAE